MHICTYKYKHETLCHNENMRRRQRQHRTPPVSRIQENSATEEEEEDDDDVDEKKSGCNTAAVYVHEIHMITCVYLKLSMRQKCKTTSKQYILFSIRQTGRTHMLCGAKMHTKRANNNNSPNDDDVEFVVLPSPNIQIMKMTTNKKQANERKKTPATRKLVQPKGKTLS